MVRLSALRARATRASSRIEPSRSHTLTRWRAARAEGDKHEIILALEPQNHTAGEVLMRQNVQPAMQSLLFVLLMLLIWRLRVLAMPLVALAASLLFATF